MMKHWWVEQSATHITSLGVVWENMAFSFRGLSGECELFLNPWSWQVLLDPSMITHLILERNAKGCYRNTRYHRGRSASTLILRPA